MSRICLFFSVFFLSSLTISYAGFSNSVNVGRLSYIITLCAPILTVDFLLLQQLLLLNLLQVLLAGVKAGLSLGPPRLDCSCTFVILFCALNLC